MRIIDLLNKIANNEDVPEKIKYDTLIYVWKDDSYYWHYKDEIASACSFLESYRIDKILNDTVEIIEEDKPIEKLVLEEINNKACLKTDTGNYNVRMVDVDVILKINEIIDKVNELSHKTGDTNE